MQEFIGGYMELELPRNNGFIHDDGVLLNCGRSALEFILLTLSDIRHLYVPYYTCEVVLEPIKKLKIPYSFYRIDEKLELNEYIELDRGDYLLYTNYFGLKDKYIKYLSVLYGSQLIVDNSQAFFAEPVNVAGVFYSPRKFIGISDGGIVYCRGNSCIESIAKDISYNRFSHLLKRIDVNPQEGYSDFRMNSQSLSGQPIKIMSDLSRRILTSVNYKNVKSRRRKNYGILNKYLGNTNQLHFGDLTNIACPMVYPYLLDDLTLKQKLIDNSIFVATYWPNVMQWCKQGDWEYELAQKTCFLPIDQRYGEEEMNKIIETICKQ